MQPENKHEFRSFRSNILEVKGSGGLNGNWGCNHARKMSVSLGRTTKEGARPLSSKYHIRKTQVGRWESESKMKQQLNLSEQGMPLSKEKTSNFELTPPRRESPAKSRKTSVEAVYFPVFNLVENSEMMSVRNTAVGRVRRLLKAKKQIK